MKTTPCLCRVQTVLKCRKCLQRAISNITAPSPSEETQAALANAKKPRKRVQVKTGEVFTTQVVLKRLQHEAKERAAKKKTKVKKARKLLMKEVKNNTEDLRNDENDVSDEDEDLKDSDETVCSICNHLCRDYTKKGNWLICDICDEYKCLICVPKGTDLEQGFYCKNCTQ